MVEKIVEKQREFFHTDQTKDITFRIRQLKKLKYAIRQKEDRILEALYLDLGKYKTEAFMTEVAMVYSEIDTALKQVKNGADPGGCGGVWGHFPLLIMYTASPMESY